MGIKSTWVSRTEKTNNYLICGIHTTKISWSTNIFLTKYLLSIFSYLLFAEKMQFISSQSPKMFSIKTGFEELKQSKKKVDKKNIRFGGLDATNEV